MTYAPSDLTRAKRMHKRAAYDEETVHAILDAQPLCTVGYVFDGQPVVTPTLQWREGNHIYWHGSSASRMLESSENAKVCVNVTIFDGMVMARSAFNHSCNYRSVMAFGTAYKVKDAADKEARLKTMVEHLFPGRWDILRQMSAKELKATTVFGPRTQRGFSQGSQRPAGRRRGRFCAADLGGCDSDGDDHGNANPLPASGAWSGDAGTCEGVWDVGYTHHPPYRHSRESGNPGFQPIAMRKVWIPTFVEMTGLWEL